MSVGVKTSTHTLDFKFYENLNPLLVKVQVGLCRCEWMKILLLIIFKTDQSLLIPFIYSLLINLESVSKSCGSSFFFFPSN